MLDIGRGETSGVAGAHARPGTSLPAPIEYIASRGKIHKSRNLRRGAHSALVVNLPEEQSQDMQLEDPRCRVSHWNWWKLKYTG